MTIVRTGLATPSFSRSVCGLLQDRAPRRVRLEPVLRNDRPHDLIERLAVLQQRSTQHTLLYSAKLAQRAVAAAVLNDRAGFQSVDRGLLEGEVERHPRAGEEDARPPERRAYRKSPLRYRESRRDCPDLHKTHCMVAALGNHPERELVAILPFAPGPGDELLEPLRRRRRWRDELRDFFCREHRQ